MPSRPSRRSVASKAATPKSNNQISSPLATPATPATSAKAEAATTGSKKRKAPTAKTNSHGSAHLPTPSSTTRDSNSPNETGVGAEKETNDVGDTAAMKPASQTPKKRKRVVKQEEDDAEAELPHNVGEIPEVKEEQDDTDVKTPLKKSPSKSKTPTAAQAAAQKAKDARDAERAVAQLQKVKAKYAEDVLKRQKALENGKKTKSETYGLSEGDTPFPNWPHPTAEECHIVHDVLSKHHPECKPQPKTVPEPSKFVAGCGEVRSILDALIRTRLSASTTSRNSSTAYQGMVKRYGLTKQGVGKGSVDYTAVHNAPVQDLFHAIKGGGLAASKSADIMAILDIVSEENQERKTALLSSTTTASGGKSGKKAAKTKSGSKKGPQGAEIENEEMKKAEIKLAEQGNLSLDHYYTLPTYAAIYKFMTLPGIGVKTAACVAMFCMQRPCFAVDTHVFRLAKWLGWVPDEEWESNRARGEKKVDRDTTFSHLEVRVPDELKYMLHQLLIRHGKTCPRCRGATAEGGKGWGKGCVIEELVRRTGARKGGGDSPEKKKSKAAKRGGKKGESEDEEMEDLDEEEEQEEAMDEEDDEDDGDDAGAGDSEADYTPRKALDKVVAPASSARSKRGAAVSARKKLVEAESEDEEETAEPKAKRRR